MKKITLLIFLFLVFTTQIKNSQYKENTIHVFSNCKFNKTNYFINTGQMNLSNDKLNIKINSKNYPL